MNRTITRLSRLVASIILILLSVLSIIGVLVEETINIRIALIAIILCTFLIDIVRGNLSLKKGNK
jgi:type III secretory pathway component EscS